MTRFRLAGLLLAALDLAACGAPVAASRRRDRGSAITGLQSQTVGCA